MIRLFDSARTDKKGKSFSFIFFSLISVLSLGHWCFPECSETNKDMYTGVAFQSLLQVNKTAVNPRLWACNTKSLKTRSTCCTNLESGVLLLLFVCFNLDF